MLESEFLKQLDHDRIVKAISEAEKLSSGEIRVYVSHKERHDAMEFAKRRFQELGMMKTRDRNGVLIYIVPRTRQFAVIGDEAIHQRCGNEFWTAVAKGMSQRMKEGKFTEALVEAIAEIGRTLARHFPAHAGNPNELSNQIQSD